MNLSVNHSNTIALKVQAFLRLLKGRAEIQTWRNRESYEKLAGSIRELFANADQHDPSASLAETWPLLTRELVCRYLGATQLVDKVFEVPVSIGYLYKQRAVVQVSIRL